MKRLFLASSAHRVAGNIAERLGDSVGRKLVFVITASETDTGDVSWREADRKALVDAGFEVTDYTFTGKTKEEIEKDLGAFDVLYIEGGNTYYLLQKIQETDCAEVICRLIEDGMPYIGCSAGSCVVGPDIYPLRHTDPLKEFRQLTSYKGLGLVNFLILPHWGSPLCKDLYLSKRIKFNYNEDHKLMLLTDNQYVIVEDEQMQFIDIRLDT